MKLDTNTGVMDLAKREKARKLASSKRYPTKKEPKKKTKK